MSSAVSNVGPQPVVERTDTLALLFQGIFTGIVRIQAGKQPLSDLETFRRRMKTALQEVEREALSAGYNSADLRDAQFAVVALLDESILSSKEPGREQWRAQPLNNELFGQAIAGEVFFDKLNSLSGRGDSIQLADVLEVYLLCLLLGFEGRMSGSYRGEALVLGEKLRRRIEAIRGTDYKLSPPLEFAAAPQRVIAAAAPSHKWLLWSAAVIGGMLLLFFLYWFTLDWPLARIETPASAKSGKTP